MLTTILRQYTRLPVTHRYFSSYVPPPTPDSSTVDTYTYVNKKVKHQDQDWIGCFSPAPSMAGNQTYQYPPVMDYAGQLLTGVREYQTDGYPLQFLFNGLALLPGHKYWTDNTYLDKWEEITNHRHITCLDECEALRELDDKQ